VNPDSKELARSIHEKTKELRYLLEQVKLKFPGQRGERWADMQMAVINRIIRQTKESER